MIHPYAWVAPTRREFIQGNQDGVGGGGFNLSAVTFNGIADFISKSGDLNDLPLTASTFLAYFWVNQRFFDNDGQMYLSSSSFNTYIYRNNISASSTIQPYFKDVSGGTIYTNGTIPVTSANGWTCVGVSLDTSNILAPIMQIMVGNAVETPALVNFLSSPLLKISGLDNWQVAGGESGSYLFGGDMAMAYMKFGAPFFDLTNVSNRRKIITAAGKPVNPGADGSNVTGSPANILMRQAAGDTNPDNFCINYGIGGMDPIIFFTVGAPTIAPTSPSD